MGNNLKELAVAVGLAAVVAGCDTESTKRIYHFSENDFSVDFNYNTTFGNDDDCKLEVKHGDKIIFSSEGKCANFNGDRFYDSKGQTKFFHVPIIGKAYFYTVPEKSDE